MGRFVRRLTRAAFVPVLVAAAAVVSGAGCDDFTPKSCPAADPPVKASYADATTIVIDLSSDADTGTINYGLVPDGGVTGGRLSFQDSGKALTIRIEVDPTAKTVTAVVPISCTDGTSGRITVVLQIPVAHAPGDAIPATIQ
jgi:hypothetical protein